MPDTRLYVIVHHRADRVRSSTTEVVHDCCPDASYDDVRERAEILQRGAVSWGRAEDTYRVAELRFVDDGA
jgi:hypothetical protein